MIENWRRHYNTVRPHSSLGYRPPPTRSLRLASTKRIVKMKCPVEAMCLIQFVWVHLPPQRERGAPCHLFTYYRETAKIFLSRISICVLVKTNDRLFMEDNSCLRKSECGLIAIIALIRFSKLAALRCSIGGTSKTSFGAFLTNFSNSHQASICAFVGLRRSRKRRRSWFCVPSS